MEITLLSKKKLLEFNLYTDRKNSVLKFADLANVEISHFFVKSAGF